MILSMTKKSESNDWYSVLKPDEPITQGDIVCGCPVLKWNSGDSDTLSDNVKTVEKDVIVMSQVCDLQQAHIREVILCPTYQISTYKEYWTAATKKRGDNPTQKAWKTFRREVRDGKIWNLAMLDGYDGAVLTEIRIVDFYEIFSLPRSFLESWLKIQSVPRLTLLPPYREHLSQAFARYFMRVGLPTRIEFSA